jgi:selenocysteine lyase/cysteine desulfurase
MLGLSGIGIFYVERGLIQQLQPVLVGWRSTKERFNFDQARLDLRDDAARYEEGNIPYSLIEGMGAAIDLLLEVGMDRVWARIRALNDHLIGRLREAGHEVRSPADPEHRSGAVVFRPREGDPKALAALLEQRGIIVSCRRGAIRVSPHFYNVEAELDRVVEES